MRTLPILFVALSFSHFTCAYASSPLRTVALSGDPAGTPQGGAFSSFGAVVLNELGQTAFTAQSNDSQSSQRWGVWSEGSGTLANVASGGSPAAGTAVDFAGLQSPAFRLHLSDTGNTTFMAHLEGPGLVFENDEGVWTTSNGVLELAAREGSQAPGMPAGARFTGPFEAISTLAVNNLGQIGLSSMTFGLGPGTAGPGVWIDSGGGLDIAVAPSVNPPIHWVWGTLTFNDAGVAAIAGLPGPGFNPGIWYISSSGIEGSITVGTAAPGKGPGVTFLGINSIFTETALNNAGETAFAAEITGPGLGPGPNVGIWTGKPDDLRLVAFHGDAAPGANAAFNLTDYNSIVVNGAGNIAFYGKLQGAGVDDSNDRGIWAERAGQLRLVAREGDLAPGAAAGTTFKSVSSIVTMNGLGQVAFSATLAGAGVTDANDGGIWALDIAGQLRLLVREGDQFEVAPGDFRTIAGAAFVGGSGNEDGRPSGFNDRGQLAFWAAFTDGTRGVFVTSAVAVPEPGGLTLLLAALGCALRLRR